MLFAVVFGTSFAINDAYATDPNYHGHKWFWENTDVQYGSFSSLNIGQTASYASLDAARAEINSVSDYHMDKVSSSGNYISTAGWADLFKLGQEYHHESFGYSDGTDVEFNDNVTWSSGTSTTNVNLRAVATHEFFHSADMLHVTSGSDTVMYRYYYYSIWVDLSSDDEDKMETIYG